MNRNEIIHLLAYMAAFDRRTVGEADVAAWQDVMPANLDLDTAKAAVRVFFAEPEREANGSTWFTPKHLLRCVRTVKREREVEAARERAKHPAIEAAYPPPAEGWRARVPGGYPEDGPAPQEPAEPEFTAEQMAANRAKLADMIRAPRANMDGGSK